MHAKGYEYPNIRFTQNTMNILILDSCKWRQKKEYLPSSTSKSTGSANVKDREVAFSSENKALVFN